MDVLPEKSPRCSSISDDGCPITWHSSLRPYSAHFDSNQRIHSGELISFMILSGWVICRPSQPNQSFHICLSDSLIQWNLGFLITENVSHIVDRNQACTNDRSTAMLPQRCNRITSKQHFNRNGEMLLHNSREWKKYWFACSMKKHQERPWTLLGALSMVCIPLLRPLN